MAEYPGDGGSVQKNALPDPSSAGSQLLAVLAQWLPSHLRGRLIPEGRCIHLCALELLGSLGSRLITAALYPLSVEINGLVASLHRQV